MRKILTTSFILLFMSLTTGAQRISPLEQLKADPRKSYGTDYPYRFTDVRLTPAPAGYSPFYISHYGRHGSRYYWSDRLYKELDTLLTVAHERQQLTNRGEQFYDSYMAVKKELMTGWGELTQLGWEQHQRIARTMYYNFPEVFCKGGNVMAVASLVGRCVISMSAFCQELVQCNPMIEIREQSSRFTLHSVVPDDKQNPLRRTFPQSKPRYEKNRDKFKANRVESDAIVSRVFTSTEGLKYSKNRIGSMLANLYTSLPNIGYDGMMDGILTDEEIATRWELSNLGSYSWVFKPRYEVIPILEDIIEKADAVVAGKIDRLADLRFGHDSYIGPMTVLMGINGADLDPEDPNEVKNCYQNWETCMASNIQLVFYRCERAPGEVLLKCLLNGEEAVLPVPTTMAPYYKWSDFRQFYLDRMASAQ